ncbi:MAG: bifunctional DNA-formamidopyrimidine glycosylase/DNA-(apurinic or apyrimidinic site) lyase [Candidatus Marinimicrobia bacterium]|nr:bifunctional DNA-formamidopyrimidine glycosylase/DNA-(apurinic or apyrimidinic site) lyase [Candidatus Neomarinimicrobiota bacterium]
MPELPEVETIKRDLNRLIVGRQILAMTTDSPKQVKPSLVVVKKAVTGTKIKQVKRRAKLIQIFLSNKQILVIHLKLTGRLLVRKKNTPKDDWQHVTFSLSGDRELRFCDLRKFGWVRLLKDEQELKELLAEFGPEPLASLNLKKFKEILVATRRAIKIVLMDQKKISGVGNIYANDALFLARIDPRRPANNITDPEAKKLYQAIEKVLQAGIKYRGASDQYYLDALGKKGAYQEHFLTYGRQGKPCFDCGGTIKRIKIGGRGTFFCPKCQK